MEMECTWDPSKISTDVTCSAENLTCGKINLSQEQNSGVLSGLPTISHI